MPDIPHGHAFLDAVRTFHNLYAMKLLLDQGYGVVDLASRYH